MAVEENKGILLETGTNEFEIVEFSIGSVNYGINVAKVREVINIRESRTVMQLLFFSRGLTVARKGVSIWVPVWLFAL